MPQYIGDMIFSSIKLDRTEKENKELLVNTIKEVIQSTEVKELSRYLQRTEFNFETKEVEVILSFPCR